MSDPLFKEIDLFENWAKKRSDIPQDDRGGEWECEYANWTSIYEVFENFINISNPSLWTQNEKQRLLYIIARDNETEYLAKVLNEQCLIILTKEAIANGGKDDKWQLAVQLHKISDRQLALVMLDSLVNDDDEYVNRRALIEMAKLKSEKVEFYAKCFWDRNIYGDMDEYQKIAVIHSLKLADSKLLHDFISKAKCDGRKYLVDYALKIESL